MEEVKPGIYEHFKGKRYQVLFTARDSTTLEERVIYKALYDSEEFGNNAVWIRSKTEFLETVDFNGKQVPRFRYIG